MLDSNQYYFSNEANYPLEIPFTYYPSNCLTSRVLILLLLFLVGCTHAQPRPPVFVDTKDSSRSVETIDTRPGVQQNFLHIQPTNQLAKTLIFFPGGNGYGQFQIKENSIQTSGNFLVRTLGLWNREYRLVVIGTPSDNAYGMSDSFRNSMDHCKDILKVMDMLSNRGANRILSYRNKSRDGFGRSHSHRVVIHAFGV